MCQGNLALTHAQRAEYIKRLQKLMINKNHHEIDRDFM